MLSKIDGQYPHVAIQGVITSTGGPQWDVPSVAEKLIEISDPGWQWHGFRSCQQLMRGETWATYSRSRNPALRIVTVRVKLGTLVTTFHHGVGQIARRLWTEW